MLCLTEKLIHALQKLANRMPRHLSVGRHGETEAYFYLRRLGYRMVAANFRAPRHRGEIDLIGWDGEVLCFIEVKTRTDDSFAPPSTAVTKDKQAHIRTVAKAYLRRIPAQSHPACRFDVVSVVPSTDGGTPHITLRKAAFSWSSGQRRRSEYHDFFARRFRGERGPNNLPSRSR